MLDGRFDGILPGFAAINYTESTDQSTFHGGTLAVRINQRRPAVRRAPTRSARRPTTPARSRRQDVRMRTARRIRRRARPTSTSAEARAVGELDAAEPGRRACCARSPEAGSSPASSSRRAGRRSRSSATAAAFIAVQTPRARSSATAAATSTPTTSRQRPAERAVVRRFARRPVERRLPERHLHGGRLPDPGAGTARRARTQYVPRAALLQRGPGAGEDRPHAVGRRPERRRSAAPAGVVQPVQHAEPQQPGQQHDQRHLRPIGRRSAGPHRPVLDTLLVLVTRGCRSPGVLARCGSAPGAN